MGLFHFHRWKYFKSWVFHSRNQYGRSLGGYYRHCSKCGRWQEKWSTSTNSWWEDCGRPAVDLEVVK